MQKKFLSNLAITLGVNILVKPLWILGVDLSFQNRLGLEQYGIYTNLFTFSLMLGLLLDFGVNNYNTSSLAKNPGMLGKQFVPLLSLKALLAGVYLLSTFVLGWLYGFGSHELYLLFVLSINQCMAYASTYFRSTLTGLHLYRTDACVSAIDRLTMVVGGFALLLLWNTGLSIDMFIYVQSAGYFMAMVISFLTLSSKLKQIQYDMQWGKLKPVFYRSLPYAILALVMMLYSRMDVLLIKKLTPDGDIENGMYVQGTRLLDAVNMMAVMVSGLLLPMFSAILKKRQSVTPLVKLAMLIMFVPAIMGVMYCYAFGNDLMKLLYDEVSDYQVTVFKLCISSVLPMCVMYVFGTLITAKGKLDILIRLSLIALVFNITVNLYVIPRYGAMGAGVVALITNSFIALSNTYVALSRLPVNITPVHLFKFPVLAFLLYAALVFFRSRAFTSWPLIIMFYGIITVVLVLVLQIMDKESFKKAVRRVRE